MSKAFTKASDEDDDTPDTPPGPAAGGPIYMTRNGWLALKRELDALLRDERPKMVETVAWAAGNGDRSENGDYIYGKKRLREIDRRIRFLIKRLENATVVDPAEQTALDQVFFGATVVIADDDGSSEQTYQIVGDQEADVKSGLVSISSPIARALIGKEVGDAIEVNAPGGARGYEILKVVFR